MPVGAGWISVRGKFVWTRSVGRCVKKWAVAPVSATTGECDVGFVKFVFCVIWLASCRSKFVSIGGLRVMHLGVTAWVG